jgi:hypothetical protein
MSNESQNETEPIASPPGAAGDEKGVRTLVLVLVGIIGLLALLIGIHLGT